MKKIFLTIFFFFFLFFPANVFAKSYSITSDKFDILIKDNKSIAVSEQLTYDFSGSYSWAEMWIPAAIDSFSVNAADGSAVNLLDSGNRSGRFYAKWGYRANDEAKTFLIKYRGINAVKKYQDVAELYWKVIGSDWQIGHHNVDITVHLPQMVSDKSEILVYGHGPLNGQSEIVDLKTAKFTAQSLAAGQFMEIRVIFPAPMILGNPDGGIKLTEIKNEEKGFVEQTIAAAKQAQQQAKSIGRIMVVWALLVFSLPFLWVIILFYLWKKYGREYKFPDIPEYVRELPSNLNPAQVDILLKQGGKPQINAFTATLFDLARKGYLQMHDEVKLKSGLLGTKKEIKTTLTLDKRW